MYRFPSPRCCEMAADHVADKRARLLASRTRWSDRTAVQPFISPSTEEHNQNSVQQWLLSLCEEDAKPEIVQEAPGQHLKKIGSSEDDLALGVEASLYGKPTAKTIQGYLRYFVARPPLPRWSSLISAFSNQSESLSVMDVLNLWQDDPEELLLDLGFGVEEPDITVRIPARFINHQSKARGIDIQLFLEAQKNRIDIENPDVRNRFRQLEVLQQVTTAFSSLVGGSAQGADRPMEPPVSAETRERRRRLGMLLRKASKKTLSQLPSSQDQQPLSPPMVGPATSPDLPADPPLDRRSPMKRAKQCPPDSASLSPLAEEQGSVPEAAAPTTSFPLPQKKNSNLKGGREVQSFASPLTYTQKSRREMAESFELEEIQSFDEGSIAGSPDPSGSGRACLHQVSSCVVRTNSCQSDSSGFLEEPCVPAVLQHPSPGPDSDLMKVLSAISGDGTDNQQRSVDQQEIEFSSSDQQSPGRLLKHTDSSITDSNTDPAMEPAPNEPLMREGETAESLLQEDDQTDCLVYMDVVQKDIAHEDVGKSNLAQGDPVSSPPAMALEGDSQTEILKSDHTVLNMWSSTTHEDANMETENVADPSTEPTEVNNVGWCLGCSVSVQMQTGLASVSQRSLRKGMSHNSSLDHIPISDVQPEREASSLRSVSYGAVDNLSNPTHCTTPPLPELPAPLPHMRHSQESPEEIRSFRLRSPAQVGGLSYEEDELSKGTLWAGSPCCCSCDHNCRCCCQNWARPLQSSASQNRPHKAASLPYSLDELEDMMRCMRRFWRVLSEIEERLEEEQASVLSSMSDAYRAEVREVLELRAAVKQEAGMLEQQLTDLAHAYDDSIKMKLNRLLDEQSHLYSQLSITSSDTPLTGHTPTRSVGIQCCLLPVMNNTQSFLSQGPTNDTNYAQDSGWSPNSKGDKLDFVGFIKSLKDLSIGNDSLE
ncbi:uncharacterized protein itprid1 isoform X2 [Electrophorus electricus]|uniref:uncharacterized protein itprid1 isoform X2 n=1 Tax=Electrophorus electricus TaxID=8005 RepID=UPI0015D0B27B|nr:uncharacterized protein itprid1 isoform X2 [Electrophorus electricus]